MKQMVGDHMDILLLSFIFFRSIRDGDGQSSRELERLCGRDVRKRKITTYGNRIFLEFVTDVETEDKGFSIFIWSTVKPKTGVEIISEGGKNQCGQVRYAAL